MEIIGQGVWKCDFSEYNELNGNRNNKNPTKGKIILDVINSCYELRSLSESIWEEAGPLSNE